MICSPGIMEAPILGGGTGLVKRSLLRRPRRVPGMLRLAMRVTEIKIPQIDRQRHRRAQDAHRVALEDRKITEHQQTPDCATFPKAERDHAFPRTFRRDPLNDEPETENERSEEHTSEL